MGGTQGFWMSRPDIPDQVLQDIADYYIHGASAKGFLEYTDLNIQTDQVLEALDWFHQVVTERINE